MPIGHNDTDGEFNRVDSNSIQSENVSVIRDPAQTTEGLSYNNHSSEVIQGVFDRGLRVSSSEEVRITETTIDSNQSGEFDVVLQEFDDSEGVGEVIDSTTVSITTGVQTLDLDITVPDSDGDYFFGAGSEVDLNYIDVYDNFPVEGELLTVVEGATPEAFVGPRPDYYYFFDIGVEQATPPEAPLTTSQEGELEFERITGRSVTATEVAVSEEPASETTALSYDEWSSEITTYLAASTGPRVRSEIDGDVRITGATVDADAAGDTEVVLDEINDDGTHGRTVDSDSISVTEGRNEIEFDIVVPGTGDVYVLTVADSNTIGFGSFSSSDAAVPYPIEGDVLTLVRNSHPEGYSGPSGDYTKFFDVTVEEANPETSPVRLNDNGAVQFEETEVVQQNGVYYAPPGEMASVLDSAPQGSTVTLYPGATYTVSSEVTVPREVRLDGNGALIKPSGDHNVFFLEPDCHLKHLNISVRDVAYTSKAIEINTEKMGDTYHGGSGGTVISDVNVRGDKDNMGGDGVYIRIGGSQWYSANQEHQFAVSGMENGLHVDVDNGGHANGNIFKYSGWDNGTQIRHSGTGPFESQIIGELDATTDGAGTDHMIVNANNTGRTCTVYGKMYDPFNCAGSIFVGLVNMKHHGRPHVDIVPNSPEAEGLIVSQDRNELLVVDLGQGISWRQLFYSGDPWLRIQVDMNGGRTFSDIMSFRMGDGQVRMSEELVANALWVIGNIDLGGGAEIRTNSDGTVSIEGENGNILNTGDQ